MRNCFWNKSFTTLLLLLVVVNADSNFFNDTIFGYYNVNQTTGAQLFYQFIPAAGFNVTNTTKPIVMFMQGGPGCASQYANLIEIGPYYVQNQSGTLNLVPRNITWNSEVNLLFIDNPSDAGYSIPGSQYVLDSTTTAIQLCTLLVQFFNDNPSLAKLDFWVMGESYGGHYVPAVAYQILTDFSTKLPPLKGIAIQNPWTDAFYQLQYFGAVPYAEGVIDPSTRDFIESWIVKGQMYLLNQNLSAGSQMFDAIENYIVSPPISGGIFINNFRYFQTGDPYAAIFNSYGLTDAYLGQASIKEKFTVPANHSYSLCNGTIYEAWSQDSGRSFLPELAYALERTKVIIYNGADDMECNTAGVLSFIRHINWSGQSAYRQANKVSWQMKNNKIAGTAKVGGNLTFLSVYDAGHYVPFDQPLVSLDMLQRIMADNDNWAEPFNL